MTRAKRETERDSALQDVIISVIEQRSAGERVVDDEVIEAHPHLMPQLLEELKALRQLERAADNARKASAVGDPAAANAGRLIIPGYVPGERISEGGQGTVFRGESTATRRAVAIKVLHGGAAATTHHRHRFERESEILAELDHPNIVGILDRGRTPDGSLYIVMPLIRGEPLDAYVYRHLPGKSGGLDQCLRLFAKVARAIHEAHMRGVVHRDLKPSNILIDERGEPHILDFGLATFAEEGVTSRTVTGPEQILGSLPWTSPEQAAGNAADVDQRTDVYALGVMLYQALSGSMPYDAKGPLPQVLANIAKAVPTPPSRRSDARWRRGDAPLDEIVTAALAKQPEFRQASAAQFAKELEDWLSGRPSRKPRAKLLWAAAAGMLLIVGVLVSIAPWLRPGPPSPPTNLPKLTNSVGMRLVRIPAGVFYMGSPAEEQGRGAWEQVHTVTISRPFYLSVTEVTQLEYRTIVGTIPQQGAGLNALPVINVSWDGATEFCRLLSKKEAPRRYRLPTEAEWEYACRAGTRGAYSGPLDGMGWYKDNSSGLLHPVGGKTPNPWGLYDMHGSVREWCQDGYGPLPHTRPAADPLAAPADDRRVVRGGSGLSDATDCRSASRDSALKQTGYGDVGFRVVLESQP